MRRALVNNCGLFFTGYNAGVNAALCQLLGPDYFQAHYCSSGSIFGSLFYATGQPETMLKVWRHHVCEGQLIRWHNPFYGRRILDLDYLFDLFQSPAAWLDINALRKRQVKVVCVLTNYHSGSPIYACIDKHNVWQCSRGTCAVPYLHGPVGTEYGVVIDGGMSVACPVERALEDGYDEVVVVYNKSESYTCSQRDAMVNAVVGRFLPRHLRELLETADQRRVEAEQCFSDPRVKLIRAQQSLPIRSWTDGNKKRLNATIDLGIADAERFVSSLP